MTVAEAIQIQKNFVARKYHIYRFSNQKLKESMKILTNAYDELWDFLMLNHTDIVDEFIDSLED